MKINGVQCFGDLLNSSIKVTRTYVEVNGKKVNLPDDEKRIEIVIDSCDKLEVEVGDVEVKGSVAGAVKVDSGNVTIGGDVGGDVRLDCGNVKCGSVGGDVSVDCGNVKCTK